MLSKSCMTSLLLALCLARCFVHSADSTGCEVDDVRALLNATGAPTRFHKTLLIQSMVRCRKAGGRIWEMTMQAARKPCDASGKETENTADHAWVARIMEWLPTRPPLELKTQEFVSEFAVCVPEMCTDREAYSIVLPQILRERSALEIPSSMPPMPCGIQLRGLFLHPICAAMYSNAAFLFRPFRNASSWVAVGQLSSGDAALVERAAFDVSNAHALISANLHELAVRMTISIQTPPDPDIDELCASVKQSVEENLQTYRSVVTNAVISCAALRVVGDWALILLHRLEKLVREPCTKIVNISPDPSFGYINSIELLQSKLDRGLDCTVYKQGSLLAARVRKEAESWVDGSFMLNCMLDTVLGWTLVGYPPHGVNFSWNLLDRDYLLNLTKTEIPGPWVVRLLQAHGIISVTREEDSFGTEDEALVKFVEVGVHIGETAKILLRASRKLSYLGIDPYLGEYEGKFSEHGSGNTGDAALFTKVSKDLQYYGDRATLCQQSSDSFFHLNGTAACRPPWSSQTNPSVGSLDFVFIDGAHDYDNVKLDLSVWAHRIRPGGIVAGHDYTVSDPGVIKAVHEALPIDTQLHVWPHAMVWWWVQP